MSAHAANESPILLLSQDRDLVAAVESTLVADGFWLITTETADRAQELLAQHSCMLALVDLEEEIGPTFIQNLRRSRPLLDVILMASPSQTDLAVRGLAAGAGDYLSKPISLEELRIVLRRRLALRKVVETNRSLWETVGLLRICRPLQESLDLPVVAARAAEAFARVARTKSVVLALKRRHETVHRILATSGITPAQAKPMVERLPEALLEPLWSLPTSVLPVLPKGEDRIWVALTFPPGAEPAPAVREQCGVVLAHLAVALENAERYERARQLAFIDDVTGLFNQRYLEVFVDKELRRAIRQRYPLSFLFLDLDHFKQVNDRFGHTVGSRLLVQVAREIREALRDIDVVVRYGGDEYVMILVNTPVEGAHKVAERIRRRIFERPFLSDMGLPETDVRISASIGIATFPEHARDRATILRIADEAMYRAKKGERNATYIATVSSPQESESEETA